MSKAKSSDDAVMALVVKVQQKKEEIKAAKKKPQWKTNCTIGRDPSTTHDRINIMTVRDPNVLVDLYAFLSQMLAGRTQAAADLDLPFDDVYMAYSIGDWQGDLKTRAAQLSIDQKKRELDALDRRVDKLVSPEQRREMEIEAIQQLDILR